MLATHLRISRPLLRAISRVLPFAPLLPQLPTKQYAHLLEEFRADPLAYHGALRARVLSGMRRTPVAHLETSFQSIVCCALRMAHCSWSRCLLSSCCACCRLGRRRSCCHLCSVWCFSVLFDC